MPTKRLRQFSFYFKYGAKTIRLLEPGDEYAIDPVARTLVINGARTERGAAFTYTYNLDDLSWRSYVEWDEEIKLKFPGGEEPKVEEEDYPFR